MYFCNFNQSKQNPGKLDEELKLRKNSFNSKMGF